MTTDRYLSNVDGKTAALCRLACGAGALESGASDDTVSRLVDFGENFGRLFQIHDDILDFVSDASKEGKPVRADFQKGILTLPVLYAVKTEIAGSRIRALLDEAEQGRFTEQDSELLVKLVLESGGIEKAGADLQKYAEAAMKALDGLPPCRSGKTLAGIVSYIAKRHA